MEQTTTENPLPLSSEQVAEEYGKLLDTKKVLDRKVHASNLAEIALARKVSKGPKVSDNPYEHSVNNVTHVHLINRTGTFVEKSTRERDSHIAKVKEFVADNFDQIHQIAGNEMRQALSKSARRRSN